MGVSGARAENLGSTRAALRRSCGLGARSRREDTDAKMTGAREGEGKEEGREVAFSLEKANGEE